MSQTPTPQEITAMAFHFSTLDWIDGRRQTSGFVAIHRDARQATQRDPDTGRKVSGGHYGSWLGALGYMVLLDQIGSCFKPANPSRSVSSGNSFDKALMHFTDLT